MTVHHTYSDHGGKTIPDQKHLTDPDAGLLTALKVKNDKEAFSLLMKKYKNPVINFCYRYCGNRQDAEDISQDVFIKVFKNIGSFKGRSRFATWLYRLTLNTCHNYKRHYIALRLDKMNGIADEAEKQQTPVYHLPDTKPDPEATLLDKELENLIGEAICHLNKKQKTILILKDFQGKSYEEIAGIMNMKTGTVKSSLARGRMQVAMKIKAYKQP